MSVLNRKLFNRGGRVSSRGVGITSGLVPVQRFSNGGEASRFDELFQEKRETLESIVPDRPEFNRFQAATPALLNFFSNLMSGRSLQGGFGGALDITGQALQQSTPLFNQALAEARQDKANRRAEDLQIGLQAFSAAESALAAEQALEADKPVFKHKGTFSEIYTYPTDENDPNYDPDKAGQKFERVIAISAKDTATGTEYGDEQILSEVPYVDGSPPTSTAKNILFTSGPLQNKTVGGVVFNDGSAFYYNPEDQNADERGLVDIKDYDGTFEFFTSQTSDKKSDLLSTNDISKLTNQISQCSQTIASGSDLLKQGQSLGSNLNTLNRFILDTGGNFLGQFSPSAKQALFDFFKENPDDLTKFIVDARTFAAQMIAPFTGEGSARISEPERELTNQTVRLFDGIIDAESALAAIEASISLTYLSQHRALLTLDEGYRTNAVNNPEENYNDWGLSKSATEFHTKALRELGLSDASIKSTILKMQTMEKSGLSELLNITTSFNNRPTDSINATQQLLYASGDGLTVGNASNTFLR